MNPFEYQNPVKVIFGTGVIARVGEEAAKLGKKALVVSYADHAVFADVLACICAKLSASGVEAMPFYEVEPNPEITMVARGVEKAKAGAADLVIGVGGGSAMDAAKAIAAGAWTPMHQVGHVLTTRHKVNHGTSLALVMPNWMEHFKTLKPERYLRFARHVMQVDPHGKTKEAIITEGIASFRSFMERSGVSTRLSQVGIGEADLPAIISDVKKVSFNADGVLSCNPPVNEATLLEILKKAL